jgi:carboxyl-terminal processing protease
LRRIAVLVFSVLFSSAIGFAALTAEQRRDSLASFDQVWSTVRDKHWDTSLNGVDWAAVRDQLRPRVEKAQSESEVRAIIGDMLSRLHQSHYAVIPGSVYRDVENRGEGTGSDLNGANTSPDGTVGIDVRVINQEALVVSVEPGSSAKEQGVAPGWIVRRIGDEEMMPVLQRVGSTYRDSTMRDMMLARSVSSRLEGPVSNPVEVEFQTSKDKLELLSLNRRGFRGTPAKFGYLPEEHVWFETRRIATDVNYIAFNFFLDPNTLIPSFQDSVRGCAGCAGIVVDLRGNPGGIGVLAMGLAGYFIDKPSQKLGTMYMRDLPLKFVVNPRPPVFEGKVAVLIDGLSASTSEIFAGGLQDLNRARIFGSRSAGAALPSMIERLPDGDGFQYAAASYKSESGKVLEGAGVTPDEPVALTRAALLAGRDPALEAAVRWIHEQSPKGNETR